MEDIPPRPSRHAAPARPLSAPTMRALASLGLSQLYSHQAEAIDALMRGEHVAVATSTASGKVRLLSALSSLALLIS